MKQIEVTILGQVYMLGCPEGGETMFRNAVAAVDHEMTLIRDAGKVKARERIAVLAALNLAFQLAEKSNAPPAEPPAPATAARADEALQSSKTSVEALLQRIDAALSEDGQLL